MAVKPVLGNGPVCFVDNNGKQYSIPLADLYFDKDGAVQADKWPVWSSSGWKNNNSLQDSLANWLSYLAKQNLLSPGDTPAPQPAFTIKAKDPGATGNFITIEFKSVKPATPIGDTLCDVTVTKADTYDALTPSTLGTVIGTASGSGQRPGLIFLASTNPAFPAADEGGPLSGANHQFAFETAFTLQGKKDAADVDADVDLTQVSVKRVDAAAKTFNLTATWVKSSPQGGVKLSDLESTFGYVIQVPGGFKAAPATGVITLSGGSDTVASSNAQAIVLAGS